jgi:hypothetical protein
VVFVSLKAFTTNILDTFVNSTWVLHFLPILFDLTTQITFGEEYDIWSSALCNFFSFHLIFPSWSANILLRLFSNVLSPGHYPFSGFYTKKKMFRKLVFPHESVQESCSQWFLLVWALMTCSNVNEEIRNRRHRASIVSPVTYIGETGRPLAVRLREHRH